VEKRYFDGESLQDIAQAFAVKRSSLGVVVYRALVFLASCIRKTMTGMEGTNER
jgi:DNA-directed RNA polymerase specialized sigma24 family protein